LAFWSIDWPETAALTLALPVVPLASTDDASYIPLLLPDAPAILSD
jgi:hypothetical protein